MAGLHFDATYNNADVMRKVHECQKAFAELGNTAEIQGKRIDAAFEKISLKSLERAIEIMKNFPKEVQGISSFQKQIDGLEKHIERVNQRIASVGGGKLGSTFSDVSSNVNIGNVLKEQVYVGAQAVNTLSEKIIQQKILIKDVEHDVRTLGEAYRRAGEGTTKGNALFADFKSSKRVLQEEKNALFELQTQQAQARLSVRKLKDEQSLYQKSSQDIIDSNNKMALSFKKTLAAIGGVAALKQLGSAIIEVRAEMQQLEKSFEVLLGSKAKSDMFVKEIKDFALISPLNVNDVSKAAQTLLGFGVSTEKVIPSLKMLGDVSMGNSQRFSSLALAFAQVQAAGKLTGNDLLQLVNSGFNPLKIISEQTGKSMADLKKEMSDGSISADMVANAFRSATEEGGQFHGMIEKNADGIRNDQNVLQGAIQETLNKIGEQNEGLIKGGYEAATYLVENYSEIGNCVSGLVGIYGTYRTALLINTVLELGSIKAVWAKVAATKAATIAQAAYNKVLAMNPYVAVGMAVVSLGIAVYTLADHTTYAEKTARSAAESMEKMKNASESLKNKINELLSVVRDETTTQYKKADAYLKLQGILPEVFKNMDIENIKLMDRLSLLEKINKASDRREIVGAKTNVVLAQKEVDKINALIAADSQRGTYSGQYEIQLSDAKSKLEAAKKVVADIEKIQIEANKQKGKESNKEIVKNKEHWDKQKKDAETALEAIDSKQRKLLNAGKFDKVDSKVVANYKEQKRLIAEAEKELKAYPSASDTTKQDKAADKLRQEQEKLKSLQDKQSKDSIRQVKDLEFEAAQAKINLMQEGSEKTIAQMNLDHQKEIETLKRNREDYLQKKIEAEKAIFEADPSNKGKSFDSSTVSLSKDEKGMFKNLLESTISQRKRSVNSVLYDRISL